MEQDTTNPILKKGKLEPFSHMNHHFDVDGIIRYSMLQHGDFNNRAFHLAVHVVTKEFYKNPKDFSTLHKHDFDEINVVVSTSDLLKYEFEMGGKTEELEAPFSVFIPAGCEHRAIPLAGEGIFICIQFATETSK